MHAVMIANFARQRKLFLPLNHAKTQRRKVSSQVLNHKEHEEGQDRFSCLYLPLWSSCPLSLIGIFRPLRLRAFA
jgi:hypothetical protein